MAYSIKWEIVRADGSSITQYDSYAEPSPFMGTNRLSNAQAEGRKGMTVHPNKAHLISWAGVVDEDLNGDAGSGSTSNAATEQGEASLIDILKTELAQASSVTVSLDCAIFDDGSCVGPDTGGYFNQLYAQIKAKKDLLQMIHKEYFTGKPPASIVSEIESIAQSPEGAELSNGTPLSHYKFYRRLFAKEVLAMRRATNDEDKEALLRAINPLRKKWITLHKKQKS